MNYALYLLDSVDGDLAGQVGPARDELGADAGLDHLDELRLVVHVDGDADLVAEDGHRVLERLPERLDDHRRVHLVLKELQEVEKI